MPARAIAFAGPSLPAADRAAFPNIEMRPPAGEGDLLAAALEAPAAIGLIDGVFGSRAAVWHKEVLWALTEGIHVLGGGSMGALRASELAEYGMVGVGWIYEAYRAGEITADDEVAVIHGPDEIGSAPLSDPLVNIRYDLMRAASLGVVAAEEAAMLVELARRRQFAVRSWEGLLDDARRAAPAIAPGTVERLGAWRRQHGTDRKRDDALLVLSRLEELRASDPAPFRADFQLRVTPYLTRQLHRASERRSSQVRRPQAR